MPKHANYTVLGWGNNGAVLTSPEPDVVLKYTRDPTEVARWLMLRSYEDRNKPLPGMARVHDVIVGNREAVVVRENVTPLGRKHMFPTSTTLGLQRASALIRKGRAWRDMGARKRGLQVRRQALSRLPMLRPMAQGCDAMISLRTEPLDVRPENMGQRKDGSIVLFDPGRTPVEALTVSPGDLSTACPNESKLRSAVFELLNVAPSYRSCRVVSRGALARVMRRHGWRDAEVDGTAGFHTEGTGLFSMGPGDLLINKGDEWAILHEMVHAAGVIDKDLAVWACEGVTEATAQDIAKRYKWRHTPTYAREVKVIRERMGKLLGMTAIEIAQICVQRPRGAGRALSNLLWQRCRKVKTGEWFAAIGPRSTSPDAFIQLYTRCRS